MTSLIVAKRYARALLELGREDGNYEQYGQDLLSMQALFDESSELEAVLANPAFDFETRQNLLNTFIEKLGLSPMVVNFFRLLMDRGRIGVVRDICTIYAGLLDEANGIIRAELISPHGLSDAEVERLTQSLKQLAGRDVKLEVKEDPSLIGGVVARIGDLVLDGSVKTQLDSLKDSLKRGDYA